MASTTNLQEDRLPTALAPRRTFVCPDCGKEIKFRTKVMEDVVSMMFKYFRFLDGTTLIETTSPGTLGTSTSSANPQETSRAQQPALPLDQPQSTLIDSRLKRLQHGLQVLRSSETCNRIRQLRSLKPLTPQERDSLLAKLDIPESRIEALQKEQLLAGEKTPGNLRKQSDLPSALPDEDDDDGRSQYSVASWARSADATDGSEPESRTISGKQIKAISKVEFRPGQQWIRDQWGTQLAPVIPDVRLGDPL